MRNLLCWKVPIGAPKALRSLVYWIVSSRICLACATLLIEQPRRSCGSFCIIAMKPPPSSPMMWSSPRRTSSKNSSAVSDSSWPTLSSFRPREKPGASAGIAKSVMPRAPFSGSVRTAVTTRSAE